MRRKTFPALVRRAEALLRQEGPASLFMHVVSFSRYMRGRLFAAETFYLYEHVMAPRDRDAFLPRVPSWELRIIHSNEEADRVAAEGLEDLRDIFVFSHRGLSRGAVVFCVYIEQRLAHVGWLALHEAAKASVDRIPYEVGFDAGQACTGGTHTIPRFRNKGLMAYGYYERFEYLRQKGFTSARNCVAVTNVASQKVHAKFNPVIYGIGYYRRVLWWTRWRAEPLPGGPCRGLPPPRSG